MPASRHHSLLQLLAYSDKKELACFEILQRQGHDNLESASGQRQRRIVPDRSSGQSNKRTEKE